MTLITRFENFVSTLLVFDEDFLLFLLSGLETNVLRFDVDVCTGIFLIVSDIDVLNN